MIALLAILTAVLSPEVLSQLQGQRNAAPGVPLCHGMMLMPMSMPMAAESGAIDGAEQERAARGGMPADHACCKVCVCHVGASALPTALYTATLLAAMHGTAFSPRMVYAAPGIFSTKTSPRGPPVAI